MMYVTLDHRNGTRKTFYVKADTLDSALEEIINKVDEEDDTGYFFEAATANMDYIRTHKNFYIVPYYGRDMVCEVVDHGETNTMERLNQFLKDHDPYEYMDNDMNLDKVKEMDCDTIINYLLDVIEEMEA